uniref:replication protein P n=1 Tax=Enterobacter sp. TaxID=42895 RepID=UPI00296E2EAF|nr:replication protein P [Enterobacter sp.]
MKSLSNELQNFDRENFQRMAHGLPEIQDERADEEQTAEIINSLFGKLRAAFPAAMNNFRSQQEFDEFRRQWLMSFMENGINTMQQVDGGMRVSRRQEKPFLPSPGQFVAWCKAEQATAAGLPNAHDLVDMVYEYCRNRGQYPDAESYPWKSNAHYWLVTTLYANMRANSLSDTELRRKAADELNHMAARINRGDPIPEPVKQLPVLGGKPLTRTQGLAKIAELREKHGLRGRKS